MAVRRRVIEVEIPETGWGDMVKSFDVVHAIARGQRVAKGIHEMLAAQGAVK